MTHGGKRCGAGRPRGKNKYGEVTKPLRVPVSRLEEVKNYLLVPQKLPLFSSSVKAGFPSPADDCIENYIDLNKYLIEHPFTTFFVKASGDSMKDIGIFSGDLLIVDRDITPVHNKVIIAALNGDLTVKRLHKKANELQLHPANKEYPVIKLKDGDDFSIWGVVIHVIHHLN